jgi:hypothetical protein
MAFLKLTDDSWVPAPDDATPEQLQQITSQGEAENATKYGQQAKDQNGPVTAGSRVYSATNSYPNTIFGQALAWGDHNLGGNWVNQRMDPALSGDIGSAALRAGTNAVGGLIDLPASLTNMLNNATLPKNAYSVQHPLPYVSQSLRQMLGVPELSADAPFAQRAAEAALTTALTHKPSLGSLINDAAVGVTSTAGSDVGGYIGGEPGAFLGGVAGAAAPSAAGKATADAVAPLFSDPRGNAVWDASMGARPLTQGGNFQGLNKAPLPGMPDYSDFLPSFTSIANDFGQRTASTLSRFPIAGAPIEKANNQTRGFVQSIKDAVANELVPGGLTPGTASTTGVGEALTQGAQDAIRNIKRYFGSQYDYIGRQMTGANQTAGGNPNKNSAEVPIQNTLVTGHNLTNANQLEPTAEAATNARIEGLLRATPNRTDTYRRAPLPLPQPPTVPYSNIKGVVSRLSEDMNRSGQPAMSTESAVPFKQAAENDIYAAADAIRPGLGARIQGANESYAANNPTLEALRKVGGKELGDSGEFIRVPGEKSSSLTMTNKMQSPADLEMFNNRFYPASSRLGALGQHIGGMGVDSQGYFRPEHLYKQYEQNKEGLETLGQVGGQPLGALDTLKNASTIAQRTVPPVTRLGLMGSAGSLFGVTEALRWLSDKLPLGGLEGLAAPGLVRLASSGLESPTLKRAMLGLPRDWSGLRQQVPGIAGILASQTPQRNVADLLYGGAPQTPGTP